MAAPSRDGDAPIDVRMRGFGETVDLEAALARLVGAVTPLPAEPVGIRDVVGRVLAEDVASGLDVPPFARSAVDGFAVHAEDTFGAAPLAPNELVVVGTSMPGTLPERALQPGEALRIMTGAPLPDGADAVVMVENTDAHGDHGRGARAVRILEAVPPGKHVGRRGEDVKVGDVVLAAGRHLRAADVAVLASIRRATVACHRRPRVAILSSGNELVDPLSDAPAGPTTIFESNGYHLEALVRAEGGVPTRLGIIRDDRDVLRDTIAAAAAEHDVVITTGAVSVGQEDFIPLIVRELGELWVHGVSIRPAHPAGFGRIGEALAFILPGNPVATYVGFWAFVRPALRLLAGRGEGSLAPDRTVRAPLGRKIASQPGRVDFARVRLADDGTVEPVRVGGAGVLTTLTRSDGMVIIPGDVEGIEAGESVEVILF